MIRTMKRNTDTSVREERIGNTLYYVVPVVSIRTGAYNERLYEPEELRASEGLWNGKPVVLNHPTLDGKLVRANHPTVEDKFLIGRLYKSEYVDDGYLRHEAWLEHSRLQKLNQVQLIQRLRANGQVEVSIGYDCDIVQQSGVGRNGQPYKDVERKLRPDHLAVLLHENGACSNAHGCGMPRVNKTRKEPSMSKTKKELTDQLINDSETSYGEDDRTTLEKMSEDTLRVMCKCPRANESETSTTETAPAPKPTASTPVPKEDVQEPAPAKDTEEKSDIELRLERLEARENKRRQAVIDEIKKQENVKLVDEDFTNMDYEQLERLRDSLRVNTPDVKPRVNYAGRGGAPTPNNGQPKISGPPPIITVKPTNKETQNA